MTDNLAFLISFVFLFQGAARGFMLTLLVPFSIIVGTIISVLYYLLTKEMIVSLLIGLVGPFLLHLLFKYLLKLVVKAGNVDIKPSILSRIGGALLNLTWGWVFIIFTLVLVAALPPWGDTMTSIHNDVTQSISYSVAKPFADNLFGTTPANPDAVASAPPSANDAKTLAEDPRFQKVLQDPDIQKDIDSHDIVKLMSNPKMMDLTRQIMSDPATMKKIMALYNSQTKPQLKWAASENNI